MPRRLAILSVLCLIAALHLAGQSGVVKSGTQPIPGATVTASAGDKKSTTTTDETGRYELPDLAPGAYTIEVRMFGFQTARKEVTFSDAVKTADISLEIGQPQQAAAGQFRRNGQNGFQNLQQNQAETQINNEIASAQEAPAAPAPAAAGSEGANESFLLLGSSTQGVQRNPDDGGPRPGMFGGGEFGGGPNGPGAPGTPGFGGAAGGGGRGGPGFGGPGGGGFGGGGGRGGFGGPGGGQRRPGGGPPAGFIGNRTRRGREGIHGMVSLSTDNSAANARPYSLTGVTNPKAAYAQERFSFLVGGPLRIPKIWKSDQTQFFLTYNGTRAKNPYTQSAILPTPAERAGDFSAVSTIIADPATTTHTPFPNNMIPASRLNSAALGLQSFIPLPNQPGVLQNYQIQTAVPSDTDNVNGRLNQNITKKDRVALVLAFQRRDANNAQLFGYRDTTSGMGFNGSVAYTRNLGQKTINVATVTFNRNRNEMTPYFANLTNVAGALGILGTSQEPSNWGPPNLSFTNFGGLSDASPSRTVNNTAGFSDVLSYSRGKHNLSFGASVSHAQINLLTDSNGRGTFTFTGLSTSQFNAAGQPQANTGYDYADFLLSLPQTSSVRYGSSSSYFRATNLAFFGQDDFRVLPNLTLNLGLRWEYYGPFSEKYGHLSNLDIGPLFTAVAVVTARNPTGPYSGGFPSSLINPDRNNFAPRLSLAWKPHANKPLVIRTGYGIYYNGSVYNGFASRLASQPPFANTANLVTSVSDPLTIQDGFTLLPKQQITNTYAIDRNYAVGYAQSWNFSVQNEILKNVIVEANYLGTKGTRLDIQTAPNRATPGSPLTAEQRLAIGNATGFTFDSSNGDSIYHALQLRINRRARRGFQFGANYQFAKSIDDSSTFGGAGNTVAQDNNDLKAERGLSSFDRRHTFSINSQLASPPRTNNKWLKDWTLNWTLSAQTGTPLTARVLGNASDPTGSGVVGAGRAEATGQSISGGQFFNLLAFTLAPTGSYGNAGRNTIPGPGSIVINASFSRSITLAERKRLEFQIMGNNVLNHVNFSNVGTVVNAANYGLVTAAGGMRTMQAVVRFRF